MAGRQLIVVILLPGPTAASFELTGGPIGCYIDDQAKLATWKSAAQKQERITMYSRDPLIQDIVSLLKHHNVRRIAVCPGARHFQLVQSLQADRYFNLYSIVDERSAGFFAIGLIQKEMQPVAVTCTSGTAGINLASSVAEAYYQRLPLLLLTADRLPELLDQQEDQMINQPGMFQNFIKYQCTLRASNGSGDRWLSNRLLNEAFINLKTGQAGPVHINMPIETHWNDLLDVKELDRARTINIVHSLDKARLNSLQKKIQDSRVLLVLGQSCLKEETKTKIESFARATDVTILSDRLCDYRGIKSVDSAFAILSATSCHVNPELAPDIIITAYGNTIFNPELKQFVGSMPAHVEHWCISNLNSPTIIDPFRKLSTLLHMEEEYFFDSCTIQRSETKDDYYTSWIRQQTRLKPLPDTYSETYAIEKLVSMTPENTAIHIGNSLPIRILSLVHRHSTAKVFGNRGVNGIDGAMSTAIGYAAECSNDQLVLLVIGDLSFIYDINSLWCRYIPSNLRIALLNNQGGAVMEINKLISPSKYLMPLGEYTTAEHCHSACEWVTSLGFKYYAAKSKKDLDDILPQFFRKDDKPSILEILTDREDDIQIYYSYLNELRAFFQPACKPVYQESSRLIRVKRKVKAKVKSLIRKLGGKQ